MSDKNEKDKIVIDIKNIDTKAIKKQEMFLQEEAYENLRDILKKVSKEKIKKDKNILDIRSHNAVFVNGKRGSGKTQFILSIENNLKKNNKKLAKKFYFFNPIDPTLLHDNESFLTIIIAKVLNNLECNKMFTKLKEDEKKSFYTTLSNLAEAIDGVVQNKNEKQTSLECISQDQTSLMLEQYMHRFFEKVVKIVDKKRLVLLIDDVDMAFDKGFEVLEVIRKYLSSPYIVPIVTGYYDLYEYIVTHELASKNNMDKFMESDNPKLEDVFQKKGYRKLIYRTSIDYLIKIFPQDKRIKLLNLREINLKFKINFVIDDKKPIIYNSFLKYVEENIFELETSSKKFVDNLFENPLRRILQFLHGEYKKENFSITNIENIENIEFKYNLKLIENVLTELTYINEGLKYFNNNEFQKSLKFFIDSLNIKKTEKAYLLIGNAYGNLKDYENAIESFNKAIEINKDSYSAYNNIGIAYSELKNSEKAIIAFKKAVDVNPEYDSAYHNMGTEYEVLHDFPSSIECFKKAIEINPQFKITHYELGNAYIEQKEYTKAIESLNKAIEIDNNYDLAYYEIGIAFKEINNYDKAIESFNKVIEISPDYSFGYYDIGLVYKEKKEYDKAIESFNKAIKIDSDFDIAYYEISLIYRAQKEYEKAIESLKKALEINSKYDTAHNEIKEIYFEQKEYDKAIEFFKNILEINSDNENALETLVAIFVELEDYRKAKEYCKQKININYNDYNIHNSLGYINIQLKEFEKAKEELNISLSLYPDYYIPYLNLFTIDIIFNCFDSNTLRKDFESKFILNNKAMKYYKFFVILNENKEETKSDKIKDWINNYSKIKSEIFFNFQPLKDWINIQKNKEKLLEYIDIFEKNM